MLNVPVSKDDYNLIYICLFILFSKYILIPSNKYTTIIYNAKSYQLNGQRF